MIKVTQPITPTTIALLVAVFPFILAVGCGPSRPETVPVSGKVTIDGKVPPGPGVINFLPVEVAAGFPNRPASAEFDTTGRFTAKSFQAGDGLIPGRYQVSVECWKNPPSIGGPPAESFIAGKYQSAHTSGLEEVVVEPGASAIEINYNLVGRR